MIGNISEDTAMRRSREDKARSRERIVEVAAARIRQSGTEAPGVAEIMRDAGLTHGGFYKHFDSREQLIEAALQQAMIEGDQRVTDVTEGAADPLAAFVDWYVSAEHVADPGTGCAVAALGADVGRGAEPLRATYRAQVERYLVRLEQLLGSRERATVALATLVGAITVARGLGEPVLAEEILRDVRASLKAAG
jgi:TetR/AcrR family transcriptional repressor of nem operon